jgi:hypothetical protein
MALRAFGVSLGVVTIGLTALLTAQAQTGPITIPLGPPGATTPPIIETAQFTELVINTASRNPTVPRAFMIIAGTADHEGDKTYRPKIVVQLDGGKTTIWADQLVANGDEFRFTGKVVMQTVTPGHF